MTFCGNVIELVEKYKIFEDKENFILWKDIEGDHDIEVYIEENIISEYIEKDLILIDAAIGELNGDQICLLFIKKQKDVYG